MVHSYLDFQQDYLLTELNWSKSKKTQNGKGVL